MSSFTKSIVVFMLLFWLRCNRKKVLINSVLLQQVVSLSSPFLVTASNEFDNVNHIIINKTFFKSTPLSNLIRSKLSPSFTF